MDDEDFSDIVEPLLVKGILANSPVHHMLIDQGSSSDMITRGVAEQLGVKLDQLPCSQSPGTDGGWARI
uniref:Uncharacterized protein n=1 Tax=Utricularia reniformis TaxID=192314 RepID=A0A1Y0B1B9_9LAMI|nr:hypothetical protein AEK19_MT1020 [Utricularia reniformis]ART31242.1 hypothetical protein AEK19_MT1020 [Utricularia reniformis]